MARRLVSVTAAHAVLLAVAACGAGASEAEEPSISRLAPANLFPLAEGNAWAYEVTMNGETGLAVQKVLSAEGSRYRLETPTRDTVVYEVREGGIYWPSREIWLLKAPVRKGAKWGSRGGRTAQVVSVHATVETPAGAYEECVRVEESGGRAGLEITTIYCPGVGPVYVEAYAQARTTGRQVKHTAELRAAPVIRDAPGGDGSGAP